MKHAGRIFKVHENRSMSDKSVVHGIPAKKKKFFKIVLCSYGLFKFEIERKILKRIYLLFSLDLEFRSFFKMIKVIWIYSPADCFN